MQEVVTDLLQNALAENGFEGATVEVINVSHKHAGHFKGNGQSHFVVRVKSCELMGVGSLRRHRILNEPVAHLIKSEQIHAISFEVVG